MKRKIVYRVVLNTISPLSIGMSNSEKTDRDVLLDINGKPFIPATSLCGVYRSFYNGDTEKQSKIFGAIGSDIMLDSGIRVYDATMIENKATISTRDSVALDDKKTAKKGCKFDCQIVEPGISFVSYIEIISDSVTEKDIEDILTVVNSGELRFGAKTNRGFGHVAASAKKLVFATTDVDKWISFNMFDDKCWSESTDVALIDSAPHMVKIELELKQVGGLSVREYFTDANITGLDDSKPDYKQLTFKSTGKPVIPATSWAGAFRSRYKEFAGEEETKKLFGYVDEESKKTMPSKIVFDESVVENAINKKISRNSIDRFSGGAKDGALYTEITIYGGTTKLMVSIPKEFDGNFTALAACVLDLNNGFLNVGGLGSVGRGIFTVEKATANNTDITAAIKDNDTKAIASAFSGRK